MCWLPYRYSLNSQKLHKYKSVRPCNSVLAGMLLQGHDAACLEAETCFLLQGSADSLRTGSDIDDRLSI